MTAKISFKALPLNTRYVSNNLIIGARQGLSGLADLKKEGVSIVLDVRKKHPIISNYQTILCKLLGLKRIQIPTTLAKASFSLDSFDKASQIIADNKSKKIFLHCRHGLHRSVIVALLSQIKQGAVKTSEDFDNFLSKNDFFKVKKSEGFFKKFKHNKNKQKIDNFEFIKKIFFDKFM